MKEEVVTFDPELVGVLTRPDGATDKPFVLILNAGFVHRIGPGRLSVEMARELAAAGFPTLRFDLSGVGDSPVRVPPLDPAATGIADTLAAMDYLSSAQGARSFVILGLCSGARHAHNVAVADPRVVGAAMLDGAVYSTVRASVMKTLERVTPMRIARAAKRRLLRRLGLAATPARQPELEAFFPSDLPRERMAGELRTLAARKVALLHVFSGEWDAYRYPGQHREAFREVPLDSVLTERRIPDADHLYLTKPERTELLETLKTWAQRRFA